ncbi:stigma-specific STIG1-like protein 1 [Cornus florida]|uniref:stigma-specific STIG1-like protein 1 n=1 Tax=Cornus florida TaxID=4283 RepID=UPI002898B657|nr:stigma-specific STIG1-like protein 1 [Cornus florida]
MKLLIIFFILSATTTTTIVAASSSDDYDDGLNTYEIEETTSLRGLSRFLALQKLPANYTCDKFPRVCRLKGSAGPDCCKKKCVNVKTDRLNCGMCGYKCKYTETCCRGSCVNASFDKRHCGGCNKKCKKGELCVYGMCNYA